MAPIDPALLARALARSQAMQAAKEAKRAARHEEGPHLNLALYNVLRGIHPRLIQEMARRTGLSRDGVYKVLQPNYGRTPKGKAMVQKFNTELLALKEEIVKELNQDLDK